MTTENSKGGMIKIIPPLFVLIGPPGQLTQGCSTEDPWHKKQNHCS